jgi:hypothetical protein
VWDQTYGSEALPRLAGRLAGWHAGQKSKLRKKADQDIFSAFMLSASVAT